VTSEYGMRSDPITHRGRWHRGLDVGAPKGTPIRSLWAGKVLTVRRARGYGKWVFIRTGKRIVRFAHMNEIFVKRGDTVKRGEVIGTVGETGRATGPHLHLEMWERGKTSDPRRDLHLCFYN
jgi:murein DD-endopeptidase MepM/ murein hydrolase activator NlpD